MQTTALTLAPKKIAPLDEDNRFTLSLGFLSHFAGRQPGWGPIGHAVYKRTYARELTDVQRARRLSLDVPVGAKGATEEFWETCARQTEETFSRQCQQLRATGQHWDYDEAVRHAEEFFERLWEGKFSGSGRMMWFLGTEALSTKGAAPLFNCAFVSTKWIADDFADPFCFLMDFLMCGSGVGFDVRGAGTITLREPELGAVWVVGDSREDWVASLRAILLAFIGEGLLPRSFDYSLVRAAGVPLRSFGGTSSGPAPLEQLHRSVISILRSSVGRPLRSDHIADVMNLIGVCVVAGGIRRSSEIALGDANDPEFLALKDPTALQEIRALKDARRRLIPDALTLIEIINGLSIRLEHASKLSNEAARIQDEIDKGRGLLDQLCASDPEWCALAEREANHPLMTHRWASNNTVWIDESTDLTPIAARIAKNGEPGAGRLDLIRTRGRMIDPPMPGNERVLGANPCAEIGLEHRELCNVPETFPSRHESLEDWKRTLKCAYVMGKTIACIPTHDQKTNAVITRNHRLGISMAGVAELYDRLGARELSRWLDEGYRYLRSLDEEYSAWMGVGRSVRLTSVKPGGTTPLLWGVEGGVRFPLSRHYMRTVRIDEGNPMIEALVDAGYRVEADRYAPRTVVAYFPVADKSGCRTDAEVTLWEKTALVALVQRWWADNMVSNTLTFGADEAHDIERVIEAFDGQLKTVSFLPRDTHGYVQAPYIPCSEQEYLTESRKTRPFVLNEATHDEGTEDRFCSSDVCVVKAVAS